jgi:hypothetical protein
VLWFPVFKQDFFHETQEMAEIPRNPQDFKASAKLMLAVGAMLGRVCDCGGTCRKGFSPPLFGGGKLSDKNKIN